MSKSFNFQDLPKESNGNLLQAGVATLNIKEVVVKTASTGSTMLEVSQFADGHEKLTLTDRYTVEDKDGKPVQFGQYKLRKLLEATNTIPEGDFTLAIIARMLKGKKYRAELVSEEADNGKTYINIGLPETFAPTEDVVNNVTPADMMPKSESADTTATTATTAELEDDDEI